MRARSFLGSVILSISLVGALGAVAPSAVANTELNLYFDAPTRSVIDTAPVGTSVGDITVTTGDIRKSAASKAIGFYTTNQITVRADSASGREIRKVDLSLSLPQGMIFGTSLIRATAGVPPIEAMTFAVTGGTGDYEGLRGSLKHEGVAGKPGFKVSIDLE